MAELGRSRDDSAVWALHATKKASTVASTLLINTLSATLESSTGSHMTLAPYSYSQSKRSADSSMALANSISKFRNELSDATTRNVQSSRPSSTPAGRSSTPKPADSNKRTHDSAFTNISSSTSTGDAGRDTFKRVIETKTYLRDKGKPLTFDEIVEYLSLSVDEVKNKPFIKQGLQGNDRITFIPASQSKTGKDSFTYRPEHPVTNAEELKNYLAIQPTAQGISVKELKDGWPDCGPTIDQLENEGFCLVLRNKKDNTPRTVWADSPSYHILNTTTQQPQKADSDFIDVWAKTKLPGSEVEIRSELEKAGLVPTSQVKEINTMGNKRKEKRKINRKGGKTTNSHMLGILKDYSKR